MHSTYPVSAAQRARESADCDRADSLFSHQPSGLRGMQRAEGRLRLLLFPREWASGGSNRDPGRCWWVPLRSTHPTSSSAFRLRGVQRRVIACVLNSLESLFHKEGTRFNDPQAETLQQDAAGSLRVSLTRGLSAISYRLIALEIGGQRGLRDCR
jgi:hypothetical protein